MHSQTIVDSGNTSPVKNMPERSNTRVTPGGSAMNKGGGSRDNSNKSRGDTELRKS